MNIIVLTGRLTRDPELKYGQSGKAYSKITLAIPRKLNKEETDFINCVGFGKTAEVIGEYLRKGRKIGVTGRLQMNQYEHNGEKRTSYDVMIENIEFLEGKNNTSSDGKPEYKEPKVRSKNTDSSSEDTFDDDDEFPF